MFGLSQLVQPSTFNVAPIVSQTVLSDRIGAFLATYPELRVEMIMRDAVGDLVADGFDMALRFGDPPENLIAQRLADISYETYNKVTVEVVGWRDETAGSSLSFWIAKGVNPGKACNYSPTNKDALLADMKAVLGPPQDEDHNEITNTAYWRLPNAEIYFTKVSSTSSFTMSDRK